MNPSTACAAVLVDELIAGGVTEAVLSPGSRNAPLSIALFEADAAGRLRLHVRIDERTAGFLAVGLARSSGRPAVVVTTSGTAVANLHPAVLEAHHGGVPLVVISADRPPELRDVGANQVIDQRSVFGAALRFWHEFGVAANRPGQNAVWRSMVCRALAHSLGAGTGFAGPVQLNLPLVEPLLPDGTPSGWPEPLDGRLDRDGRLGPWTVIDTAAPDEVLAGVEIPDGGVPMIPAPAEGERVLFLGDLTHPAAGPLAALGHVVISEAGGAAGSAVISAGLHLLAVPGFLEPALPDRVVVLGRPTLYRQISALLADSMISVDVLASPAGYGDPTGKARRVAPVLAPLSGPGDTEFVQVWRAAQAIAAEQVAALVGDMDIGCSPRLAAELVSQLPDGATLVLGSSQPPRDVGLSSAPRDGLRLVANRGVAGIDGTISTAIGVALGADQQATVALMGDLTFLHDMTGLVIGPHEPRPELTIVVSNNGGGGIFHTLEPGEPLHARAFERVFGTPHDVELAGLVEAAGWEHVFVSSHDELHDALVDPGGIRVVEVPTSRTDLREIHGRIRAAVSRAVRG
ncbi:2-succinyl-5-enolpyruvyl-6-hydroxy-3-cyclohexene-1-carboxylate synthase [Nakamurella sp. UYEF19]|uniref:2-succinyl-5-enolpyruvyl-6-hydroxy-3- cyclohexene-1-carboxylic-acid synthase n=1 Tax=Nakamurella sp. UYEF19 TaxID=1756392 RepID=UPI00339B03C2